MTTIIKHRRTGNHYILLSINGEAGKVNPSRFINELFERQKPEVSCLATVCDALGNIFIANIEDLIVIEIDGIKPADILPEADYPSHNAAEDIYNSSPEPDEEFEEFEEELEEEPRTTDSLDAPNLNDDDDDSDWI